MIQPNDRHKTHGDGHFQHLLKTTYRLPIRIAFLAMFLGLIAVQALQNYWGLVAGAVTLTAGALIAIYVGVAALFATRAHHQVKGS
ncbi:hypothetical protein [Asticcacaulis sp. EMRT-3]|uniref:hypothetical protein n=1 Tax=Asticcacaulis sp. EMRT-3 TaxID=3040349 RepID=UPI0024AECE37|nr:hypothetical protein [Asticcacaulis sp. EMRT-3]MDI7774460.1 hypothetical protein [Asticcacaulis sp. EMRT-3]